MRSLKSKLGDQVLSLNQDNNIDAFVLLTAAGRRKSGGMKALGMATLNPLIMAQLYVINVGIVDARNGAALAYTGVTTFSDIGKEGGEKFLVACGEADAHARKVRAL